MNTDHPITREPINVWMAPEGQCAPIWTAKFGIGENFPIAFYGDTEAAVRLLAEAFRADVISKHGATYAARIRALEAAMAAKAKKVAA